MVTLAILNMVCTAGVLFFVRFLVALWKDRKRASSFYRISISELKGREQGGEEGVLSFPRPASASLPLLTPANNNALLLRKLSATSQTG
jgi:hypothetical protein